MHMILKKLTRWLVRFVSIFLPEEKARALERWRRGREEFRKLGLADCVVVSYGKSGRTWLRVMISRYYQVVHDLPDRSFMGFDNLHRKNPDVPRIFFTHDNYLRDYTGNRNTRKDFYSEKVVLLVRRPQDVAVSQYFQWKFRMRPHKKQLNRYPKHGADVSIYDFVMHPDYGLPRTIGHLNAWADELPHMKNVHVVRYEDLRANPQEFFGRVVEFISGPSKPEHVADAVQFASVDNMRSMERDRFFWKSGSRLTPRDRDNPDSYKVRRAKVGGYRDYFEDEQLARIDALVREQLSPVFGYGGDTSDSAGDAPSDSST